MPCCSQAAAIRCSASASFLNPSRSATISVSFFVSTLVELNATNRFIDGLKIRGRAFASRVASAVQ
jgi:hypothetical protein